MMPSSRAASLIGHEAAGLMERVSRTIAMTPSLARDDWLAMRRKRALPLFARRCFTALHSQTEVTVQLRLQGHLCGVRCGMLLCVHR
jgi:hypothetical protein